jgi:sugar/nucleoside kinase (ribokinase family)
MFSKPFDIIAIGDITTDAFIKIKDASTHCDINGANCTISLKFADKVPYESVDIIKAVGNSANAAVSVARLGLRSALISDVGHDQNGKECVEELERNNVATKYIRVHPGETTNYHYVLWYEAERTILVKHQEYSYRLPEFKHPQWIYLSSLAANSFEYHMQLLAYLKANPDVQLCFQPGTFQMKLGLEKMKAFYERSNVFVCNVEESQRILGNTSSDILVLLKTMFAQGPKLVLITDGPKGAYMYDGKDAWYMPIYPDPAPPKERTGCGDAFTSTFIAAKTLGKSNEEALMWAPINPMSVVQQIGAQKGLLSRSQLEELLKNAPADYKTKKLT